MGQKTHPYGFRLVYNKTWHSRWFAEGNYAQTLHQDLALRESAGPVALASIGERHPTDLAGLRGARFVASIETEQGRRWNESKVKAITGGDKVSARFMRQDFFEYTPQFKLVIAGKAAWGSPAIDSAIVASGLGGGDRVVVDRLAPGSQGLAGLRQVVSNGDGHLLAPSEGGWRGCIPLYAEYPAPVCGFPTAYDRSLAKP